MTNAMKKLFAIVFDFITYEWAQVTINLTTESVKKIKLYHWEQLINITDAVHKTNKKQKVKQSYKRIYSVVNSTTVCSYTSGCPQEKLLLLDLP